MKIGSLIGRSHTGWFTSSVLISISLSHCGRQTAENRSIQGFEPSNTARLAVSEGTRYDFGSVEVGQSSNHIFTLVNTGSTFANHLLGSFYLSLHFKYTGGTFPGSSGSCGAILEVGQTCKLDIEYSPQNSGNHTTSLILTFHDGDKETSATLMNLNGSGRMPVAP